MFYCCTYFDSGFLPKGLAMIESLQAHTPALQIVVLALDDFTYNELEKRNDSSLMLIRLQQYIDYFGIDVSKFIDRKQFYFSITPNICIYLFETQPHMDRLFYLDADMYFLQSANELLVEMGDHSIMICSHHFHPMYKAISTHYGHYNVGINGFRNDAEAMRCLHSWKHDCESWYAGMPGYPHNFFSDQIFLDKWPGQYKSLKIVTNKAIDAAPWNLNNIGLRKRNNVFLAKGKPLIVFHFSALEKIGVQTWKTNSAKFFISIKGDILLLYRQYIQQIESYGYKTNIVQRLQYKSAFGRRKVHQLLGKLFVEEISV